jgi:hypothetical protein
MLAEAPKVGCGRGRRAPARVGLAAQELHRRLEAEAAVHARHRAQRLAHDEGDLLRRRLSCSARRRRSARIRRASPPRRRSSGGWRRGGSCRPPPTASARGRAPLVGQHGLAGRVALEQAPAPRHVAGRDEQQAPGGAPSRPARPDLLVVGLDGPGGPRCTTARTSGRSMPMPKALVATMTSSRPRGTRAATSPARPGPARRGRRATPSRGRQAAASSSAPRRVGA